MVLMALGGLAADQTERVLHVWDTGLRAAWPRVASFWKRSQSERMPGGTHSHACGVPCTGVCGWTVSDDVAEAVVARVARFRFLCQLDF